jgi:hypothetical protein
MSARKPKTTPPEVLAAQEALQRAEHARLSAQRELERATQARFEAVQALQDARVRADGHLPRAWVASESWRVGAPKRCEVVVDRRTEKTIVTRYIGRPDEQQWRKGSDGKWRQWPGRGSACWLEVAE